MTFGDERSAGDAVLEVVRVMARLRAPDGCPWDREQTHATLRRQLLEEAHEVLEAIDSGDPQRLRDELGDLLIHVVFHSQIAEDAGEFTLDDVANGTVQKLVRRHPHVFGDVEADTPDQVVRNWDQIKAEEKGGHPQGIDDEIPPTLPALLRAYKVQRRAGSQGFDWRTPEAAMDKVKEELGELERASTSQEIEDEIGDLLFAVASLARQHDVDAESALRATTKRFAERFEALKAWATESGVDLNDLEESELLTRFRELR
ncbi:MAG: nucleoside triphosphate pyrophosphohydrolase [Actinobacteria bacterium]|nr:nucleoside triphosphate pyrophosphohydrolase [Actinomycetota bacterium]